MATPAIIGMFVSNLPAACAFWQLLGVTFAREDPRHAHWRGSDGMQIMLNEDSLAPDMGLAQNVFTAGARPSVGIRCVSPAEVDELYARCSAAGFGAVAPFDAGWGQRYATVLDPDGSRVDLYAPIPGARDHRPPSVSSDHLATFSA
ncbi:VOC family protein (plasmid) [Streptosporangium sp. NBC_01495]|uniref:VOC family protein n=1 Tax=Streptosporangium sp. NBC_01495 TaxID=2903899 RepID=UPI002E311C44|nr:VOC family protein [Streptosporangium sp. NBC_01495]